MFFRIWDQKRGFIPPHHYFFGRKKTHPALKKVTKNWNSFFWAVPNLAECLATEPKWWLSNGILGWNHQLAWESKGPTPPQCHGKSPQHIAGPSFSWHWGGYRAVLPTLWDSNFCTEWNFSATGVTVGQSSHFETRDVLQTSNRLHSKNHPVVATHNSLDGSWTSCGIHQIWRDLTES